MCTSIFSGYIVLYKKVQKKNGYISEKKQILSNIYMYIVYSVTQGTPNNIPFSLARRICTVVTDPRPSPGQHDGCSKRIAHLCHLCVAMPGVTTKNATSTKV